MSVQGDVRDLEALRTIVNRSAGRLGSLDIAVADTGIRTPALQVVAIPGSSAITGASTSPVSGALFW